MLQKVLQSTHSDINAESISIMDVYLRPNVMPGLFAIFLFSNMFANNMQRHVLMLSTAIFRCPCKVHMHRTLNTGILNGRQELTWRSKGRWFDLPLLQSFGCDYKPRSQPHDIVVSGTLNSVNHHHLNGKVISIFI